TNIIRNLRLKFRVWNKYRKYHNHSDFVTFKQLRKDIKYDITTAFSNFHKNIENQIGNDPNSFWNYISSEKQFANTSTLLTLFFAFVRSKMEYVNIIWFPYLVTYIADIERVQRRFLKYLCLREDGIYPP
ncbi:hypothetical protein BDFB_013440, partial [Asbolus verrucosus]